MKCVKCCCKRLEPNGYLRTNTHSQHNVVSFTPELRGTHKKRVREQELQERLTAQLSCIGHDRSDHEGRHVIHEVVHLRSNELALDDGLADTT